MLSTLVYLLLGAALPAVAACAGSDPAPPDDHGAPPPTTVAAAQGSAPVSVVNTAADPVPTAAVGTTQVAGSAPATQAGDGNVNATNPAFQIAGNVNRAPGARVAASQAGAWSVDIA